MTVLDHCGMLGGNASPHIPFHVKRVQLVLTPDLSPLLYSLSSMKAKGLSLMIHTQGKNKAGMLDLRSTLPLFGRQLPAGSLFLPLLLQGQASSLHAEWSVSECSPWSNAACGLSR